jgi:hypothetical protein
LVPTQQQLEAGMLKVEAEELFIVDREHTTIFTLPDVSY